MSSARMKGFKEYITVNEAFKRFYSALGEPQIGNEEVPVAESHNRILAEDLMAEVDLPSGDKAAMDGYAVLAEDTWGASQSNPMSLALRGRIDIGTPPELGVGKGEAVLVFTGSYMPQGANAVVMVEFTREASESEIEIISPVAPSENVARVGEDVRRGDKLLARGTRLKPPDIGLLSALGKERVKVVKQPRIGVISTGNELIRQGAGASPYGIHDVNRPTVMAMVREQGGLPVDLGMTYDNPEDIKSHLERGLEECDGVLVSAGSSVGGRDLVPEVVNSLGRPGVVVHGVAVRPSSPTGLAVARGKPVIMLPGYPVSAMLAFEIFAKPLILRMQGAKPEPEPRVRARLSRRVASPGGMRTFVRVKLRREDERITAEPIRAAGASIISSMTGADGILVIPEDREGIEAGEEVEVLVKRPLE